jgi:uncharacterized membrane protein YukC
MSRRRSALLTLIWIGYVLLLVAILIPIMYVLFVKAVTNP